ncbi:hypothetical protein BEWA_025470 [Theileria equi strain WA]|uniref:Uncharacterized protein n=1 Tax=Theileria equi strain WA TaxID=1537102 RepID=L0AWR6_THEEQ|nr:hypothetical protein BEWA_025470 [Theileria equi strain WA]AFZ79698.1 hypothetical protein BEWA_025470 [Theileria equi strain WA]|eukprot:XP_004829364.1 hypothetical protein BEWA_025470 [Theileria equi strain WA]
MGPKRAVSLDRLIESLKDLSIRSSGGGVRRSLSDHVVYARLRRLVPSIVDAANVYNGNIHILISHLTNITSNFKSLVKGGRFRGKTEFLAEKSGSFYCNVCNGSCEYVYQPMVQAIKDGRLFLSPKAISTVLSAYCQCGYSADLMLEFECRIAYFLYSSLPKTQLDMLKINDHSALKSIGRFEENDYLNDFLSLLERVNGCQSDDKGAQTIYEVEMACKKSANFYTVPTYIDVCMVLHSLRAQSPLMSLILRLSSNFLHVKFSSEKINELQTKDLNSISRIIVLLRTKNCIDDSTTNIALNLVKNHLEMLNMRDLSSLLSVFSYSTFGNSAFANNSRQTLQNTARNTHNRRFLGKGKPGNGNASFKVNLNIDRIISYCVSMIYDKETRKFTNVDLNSLIALTRSINGNFILDTTIKHFLIYNIVNRTNVTMGDHNLSPLVILLEYLDDDQTYVAMMSFILEGNISFNVHDIYNYVKLIELFRRFESRIKHRGYHYIEPLVDMEKYEKKPIYLNTSNVPTDVRNCILCITYNSAVMYTAKIVKSQIIDMVYFLKMLMYILDSYGDEIKKRGVFMRAVVSFSSELEKFYNSHKEKMDAQDIVVINKFISKVHNLNR